LWGFFGCVWQYWSLNQGFTLAKQLLYHLSHAPKSFLALVILKIGSYFLPIPTWTMNLLIYTSYYNRNNRHTSPLFPLRWGLAYFFDWGGLELRSSQPQPPK
jgi:hypothetical protein